MQGMQTSGFLTSALSHGNTNSNEILFTKVMTFVIGENYL